MNFLKALFGGVEESPEVQEQKKVEKNLNILKYDGIRALQTGQADYAVKCFTEALKLKADTEVELYLTQAYIRNRQLDAAYETLTHIVEQDAENIEILMLKAQIAYNLEKYDEVVNACLQVLQLDDTNSTAYIQKARAEYARKDVFNAIASCTKAITNAPELEQAYLLRAEILESMNQFADAEADIDYLLQHFEPTEESMMQKGVLRMKQGAYDEAITLFKQVTDLNPFHEKAYICNSEATTLQGKAEQALQGLDEALQMMPESAQLYKERGRVKVLLNDKAGAMEDVRRSLELNPEEAQRLEGLFTNTEKEMEARYKSQNPYGF